MRTRTYLVYALVLAAASVYALAPNALIARGGERYGGEGSHGDGGEYRQEQGGQLNHPGAAGYERGFNQGEESGAGEGGGGYYYPPPPPQQQEQQPMEDAPYNPV